MAISYKRKRNTIPAFEMVTTAQSRPRPVKAKNYRQQTQKAEGRGQRQLEVKDVRV